VGASTVDGAALEYEPQAEQVLLQRARCFMALGDYMAAYGKTKFGRNDGLSLCGDHSSK
jgi:hypothetical protein